VSRKTYTVDGQGPYDEEETREKVRAYCDEHGFHAALTLKVVRMIEGTTTEKRVDAGKFLDGR
jgi:hypothetical protein